jgi:predicted transcriptional regulator YdeE
VTPRLVEYEGGVVLGIDLVTSNADEADPTRGKIPGLWARFRTEDVLGTIPGKRAPVQPVGVYTDYESDHTGPFRLVAGAMVDEQTRAPRGLRRVVLRPGRYLVFGGEGELPGVVIGTWMAIWSYFEKSTEYRRAYTADFEVYPGPTHVDIYIAVK